MAPTRKRGTYVAALTATIIPFCPSVLWAQLIASHSSWRYVGLLCGIWAILTFLAVFCFYFPPPRPNSMHLDRKQILSEIDWMGGFFSITGFVLFMLGFNWSGKQYSWASTHVLIPLILGAILIVCFILWEMYFAKHPMFPHRLKQNPRVLGLTLFITWISGANFFAVLMFWPTQAFNVYGHDPVQIGLRGLPIGFGILTGAVVVLILLSMLKGHIRVLMIGSTIVMTAGVGSIACATVDNLHILWYLLTIAGLGIGGILVPASIISTIVCPDDLIATIASLTLSIRVLGGVIGYSVYYNVFISKFVKSSVYYIGGAMVTVLNITNVEYITEAIELTGASFITELQTIPGLDNPIAFEVVKEAGKIAFAEAYKWVYYTSIAFGVSSIIAACFLGDITKYMDDHIAVVIE